MTVGFRHLALDEAERELVGACIVSESAMLGALAVLGVDDFRGASAEDTRRIFYALAGLWSRGAYDPRLNIEYLEGHLPDPDVIEDYWCPWAGEPEYTDELVAAIAESKRLADAAIAARLAWQDQNPLSLTGAKARAPANKASTAPSITELFSR